jgi:alkylated DNA repair protein (DNA oxidative demethylase)
MGLHQDRDEADFTQPVLSISLGDAGAVSHRRYGTRRQDAVDSGSKAAT